MQHPKIASQIWDKKYRLKDGNGNPLDHSVEDTWWRIARALAEAENGNAAELDGYVGDFYSALEDYKYLPAGRITAGAGTGRHVTLFNCYVMGTIPDSMDGIFSMLREAALTMQQGGGIGYDFSTLRPKGAPVRGVAADASGPLTFMDVWDAMCRTVMSAGERRGAMMATMRCDHPDIEAFIEAKRDANRLRMFNLSVLVTDDFMEAVRTDSQWHLHFENRQGETISEKWVNARELWNKIIRTTYDVAEPGVIFIDRINQLNNLGYCETIAATNPCVPGDTPIMTADGYQPIQDLVDREVSIWNGQGWETVRPFSTGFNSLVEVLLSNGQRLICTPTHDFVLGDGTKVAAEDLVAGSVLQKAEHEGYQGHEALANAYSQGFYSGDGTKNAKKSWVYSPKYSVISRLCGSVAENEHPERKFRVWSHGTMLAKDYVPINERLEDRIEWLAGLLDADGTLTIAATGAPSLQLTSKDYEFLANVQLFLTGLGVWSHLGIEAHTGQSGFNRVHSASRLSISTPGVARLQELGLKTSRLQLPADYPVSSRARKLRVVSVTDTGRSEETFCFTSKETGMGIFNGILTGQCGEQPLPPYGACLLGSINLARLVNAPFTHQADLDMDQLDQLVATAVRMMDNVVDVSFFPVPQQAEEAKAKRRIGLGVTGLADALAMCRLKYGSPEAVKQTGEWMEAITLAAYSASIELAKEKGAFPLFNADGFLRKGSFAAERLPIEMQDDIRKYGIRNALLTSIAPTGTISLYAGNVSSGIEPVFAYGYTRKVLQVDGSKAEEEVVDYAVALYQELYPGEELPDYFVTAQELQPKHHLFMQAAAQQWVDSSISKTINVPETISFEDFRDVYEEAYEMGCKGCTTYRPNDVTGSVLEVKKPEVTKSKEDTRISHYPDGRPKVLTGETYKLKWPNEPHAFYITFTDQVDMAKGTKRPFEIFINSKNVDHFQWTVALTRMISAVFRRGGNVSFVANELREVFDPKGGAFMQGKYVPSLLAAIGDVVAEHMTAIGYGDFRPKSVVDRERPVTQPEALAAPYGVQAPEHQCKDCGSYNVKKEAGCFVCKDCGSSKCG
jgi:ribonucleoside-diphosphate reductase alpha chain